MKEREWLFSKFQPVLTDVINFVKMVNSRTSMSAVSSNKNQSGDTSSVTYENNIGTRNFWLLWEKATIDNESIEVFNVEI